jgi:hypothetical protein
LGVKFGSDVKRDVVGLSLNAFPYDRFLMSVDKSISAAGVDATVVNDALVIFSSLQSSY